MAKEVTVPEWLQGLIDQVTQSESWPNDRYPALAFKARRQIALAGGDVDCQAALLQLVIDEVDKLQTAMGDNFVGMEADAAREHPQDCDCEDCDERGGFVSYGESD